MQFKGFLNIKSSQRQSDKGFRTEVSALITLRKLRSLREKTALRKCARIIEEMALQRAAGKPVNSPYLQELLRFLIDTTAHGDLQVDPGSDVEQPKPRTSTTAARILTSLAADAGIQPAHRELMLLRNAIEEAVGVAVADWDFDHTDSQSHPASTTNLSRLPMKLFLDDIRSPFNMGSIFRTADAFAAEELILSEDCPSTTHPRASRCAMGSVGRIPQRRIPYGEKSAFLQDEASRGALFALELGGTPVADFNFPESGTVILGSEELGVSPEALEAADRSLGRVSIPMPGPKGSLNVAVATGILMAYWSDFLLAKRKG